MKKAPISQLINKADKQYHKVGKIASKIIREYAQKISEKEMREQELLVAQFILKYPDIPLDQITFVRQITPEGFRWYVTTKEMLKIEQLPTTITL